MADNKLQKSSALNCIVDHSALLAGLGEDCKENLKQWIHDGAINLFVPLSTLDKLNSLRRSPPPTNLEARKTLEWLDDVTTVTAANAVGRVELQGPDDQYQTWREVEKYLLPDTPLSSAMDNLDGVADDFRGRLSLRKASRKGETALRDASDSHSDMSPESSPEVAQATLAQGDGPLHGRTHSRTSSGNNNSQPSMRGIPPPVQPLLNYVVWRTYHGDKTIAGSGKYILLTNDRTTQRQAMKFGVRAKMLSQLSTIVGKMGIPKQDGHIDAGIESALSVKEIEPKEAVDEDPDEEIVFDPAQRPTSSRGLPTASKIMDPDHFGRANGADPLPAKLSSSRPNDPSPKPASRGNNQRAASGPGAIRGHGGSMRRRGQHFSRGNSAVRGTGPTGRGQTPGGQGNAQQTVLQQVYSKPIDPDSYTRPPPAARGRGNSRRLWTPNT